MDTLRATLDLYRITAKEAASAVGRSALGIVALLLAHGVLMLAALAFAPFGIVGGFLMGMLNAALVGWYLRIVELAVTGRRSLTIADLRDAVGAYFWSVISVGFVFWVASLILVPIGGAVALAAVLIATILFNTAPEQIYRDRTESVALLGDGARFIGQNWPEWFGAHLLGFGVLFAFGVGAAGPVEAVLLVVPMLSTFGPFFGFVSSAGMALALAATGPRGIALAALSLLFVHAFMVFRGVLYEKLSRGSRRSRAWQQRMGR